MAKNKKIFKEPARIPLNLNIEKDDVVKTEKQLSISCRFQSIQILGHWKKPFPTKKPKVIPFVTKSILESNCKRLRQSAIRENFNLKPETQLKKTHSQNGGNHSNEYSQVKEKL